MCNDYKEASKVCKALDGLFRRALTIEYGVANAGQRRYDECKHNNPVLEQIKQELVGWKKIRDNLSSHNKS